MAVGGWTRGGREAEAKPRPNRRTRGTMFQVRGSPAGGEATVRIHMGRYILREVQVGGGGVASNMARQIPSIPANLTTLRASRSPFVARRSKSSSG